MKVPIVTVARALPTFKTDQTGTRLAGGGPMEANRLYPPYSQKHSSSDLDEYWKQSGYGHSRVSGLALPSVGL